eukprot:gene5862-1046_t
MRAGIVMAAWPFAVPTVCPRPNQARPDGPPSRLPRGAYVDMSTWQQATAAEGTQAPLPCLPGAGSSGCLNPNLNSTLHVVGTGSNLQLDLGNGDGKYYDPTFFLSESAYSSVVVKGTIQTGDSETSSHRFGWAIGAQHPITQQDWLDNSKYELLVLDWTAKNSPTCNTVSPASCRCGAAAVARQSCECVGPPQRVTQQEGFNLYYMNGTAEEMYPNNTRCPTRPWVCMRGHEDYGACNVLWQHIVDSGHSVDECLPVRTGIENLQELACYGSDLGWKTHNTYHFEILHTPEWVEKVDVTRLHLLSASDHACLSLQLLAVSDVHLTHLDSTLPDDQPVAVDDHFLATFDGRGYPVETCIPASQGILANDWDPNADNVLIYMEATGGWSLITAEQSQGLPTAYYIVQNATYSAETEYPQCGAVLEVCSVSGVSGQGAVVEQAQLWSGKLTYDDGATAHFEAAVLPQRGLARLALLPDNCGADKPAHVWANWTLYPDVNISPLPANIYLKFPSNGSMISLHGQVTKQTVSGQAKDLAGEFTDLANRQGNFVASSLLDCMRSSCSDGLLNGDEKDVDQGGSCGENPPRCMIHNPPSGFIFLEPWAIPQDGTLQDIEIKASAHLPWRPPGHNPLQLTNTYTLLMGNCSFCGDGKLDSLRGETCDDGNALSGDNCNATCGLPPLPPAPPPAMPPPVPVHSTVTPIMPTPGLDVSADVPVADEGLGIPVPPKPNPLLMLLASYAAGDGGMSALPLLLGSHSGKCPADPPELDLLTPTPLLVPELGAGQDGSNAVSKVHKYVEPFGVLFPDISAVSHSSRNVLTLFLIALLFQCFHGGITAATACTLGVSQSASVATAGTSTSQPLAKTLSHNFGRVATVLLYPTTMLVAWTNVLCGSLAFSSTFGLFSPTSYPEDRIVCGLGAVLWMLSVAGYCAFLSLRPNKPSHSVSVPYCAKDPTHLVLKPMPG